MSLSSAIPPSVDTSFTAREAVIAPWLVGVGLLLLLIALSPIGYIGGGADDWHYVEAARCAASHGLCLPHTHWEARFPLVAPMGAVFALFGVSFSSAQIVPLSYAIAAVILFALNVERYYGRNVAILASVAFVLTPAISFTPLDPLVDLPELAWVLASLLAGQVAIERRNAGFAALAGAALALAVMTRMSTLAVLPMLGLAWLFVLPSDRRRLVWPFAFAFAAILGAEAAFYWVATGDPRYGWLLSLGHTDIATTELPSGFRPAHGALFNLDLIQNWKRSMGIHVHWTVDPLLNLLADPRCGLTLIAAGVLAIVGRSGTARNRTLGLLVLAAALYFLTLTYVLAIDPKPRMFLSVYAVAATAIGVFGVRAWRNGSRVIVVMVIGLMAIRAVVMIADRVDQRPAEAAAAEWIAAAPSGMAIDDWSRRTLALVPAAYALPVATPAARGPVLFMATTSCAEGAATRGAGWRVMRERRFTRADPAAVSWLRSRSILIGPSPTVSLCLLNRP